MITQPLTTPYCCLWAPAISSLLAPLPPHVHPVSVQAYLLNWQGIKQVVTNLSLADAPSVERSSYLPKWWVAHCPLSALTANTLVKG
jgi:hypothetical protein